ncbi:MAG TPA: tetratricopeptide repeat protein, partial [Geobacteraceae bacterium]
MKQKIFVCLALVLVTVAVYGRVAGHDFIGLDDPAYVFENPHVSSGLTLANIRWAFVSTDLNWHPLTWLSHMADVQLFGLAPAAHHLINLLFHLLNTILLFLLLSRATGASLKSAFVAALFALHPMHVESVAWVAERKDVLSTFLGFLSLLAYVRYAERPAAGRYLPVFLFFALGLMAKPMLVTLPFAMLLLDYWPLDRTGVTRSAVDVLPDAPPRLAVPPRRLLVEKVPLLLLAAGSSAITLVAQHHGGAVSPLQVTPLVFRVSNALLAYAKYIAKMLWPADLAIIYPLRLHLATGSVVAAGVLLLAISWGVARWGRRFPYLPVGWLFFLVTLVPVIGLVQVGDQSMADRYSYVPYIGLFLMATWGAADLAVCFRWRRSLVGGAAIAILVFLAVSTHRRLGDWRNSVTIFSQAVKVVGDYHITHNHLGLALAGQRDFTAAADHFRTAIRLKPDFTIARYNLGLALANMGKQDEALENFSAAIADKPDYADAYFNRALVYEKLGRYDRAIDDLLKALGITSGRGET